MKLTETWQVVARRQTKNAEWMWSLDALERIVLTKMVDEGKADIRLDRQPGGRQEMQARDRIAALLVRQARIGPPPDAPATSGAVPASAAVVLFGSGHAVSAQSPRRAPEPRRSAFSGIVYLPPAKPIGARTYVPYFGDPARWVDRPEPRLRSRR